MLNIQVFKNALWGSSKRKLSLHVKDSNRSTQIMVSHKSSIIFSPEGSINFWEKTNERMTLSRDNNAKAWRNTRSICWVSLYSWSIEAFENIRIVWWAIIVPSNLPKNNGFYSGSNQNYFHVLESIILIV